MLVDGTYALMTQREFDDLFWLDDMPEWSLGRKWKTTLATQSTSQIWYMAEYVNIPISSGSLPSVKWRIIIIV